MTADDVRARFEAHHGITWGAIQSLPIGSGSRIHLESHYKRHFDTWQAARANLSGEVRELVEADRECDEANAALRRLAMAGLRPGSYGTGWELRDAAHKQKLMDALDAALDRRSAALAKFTQEKP